MQDLNWQVACSVLDFIEFISRFNIAFVLRTEKNNLLAWKTKFRDRLNFEVNVGFLLSVFQLQWSVICKHKGMMLKNSDIVF